MDDKRLAEIRAGLDRLANDGFEDDADEQGLLNDAHELYDAVVAMKVRIRDMERVRGGGQR